MLFNRNNLVLPKSKILKGETYLADGETPLADGMRNSGVAKILLSLDKV